METAKAQIQAGRAGVTSAEAALETAKVNLGFTHLVSPIDGIAGAATAQVGTLVGPAANAVTTASTLDPIKANFTVSEQEYLSLARADALHRLQLRLVLADGSLHVPAGRFSFADRQVDPATGAIQLTGLFPNPGNTLRPGQYAKVRAAIGVHTGALLVPQRAVIDTQGTYTVPVVDPNNTNTNILAPAAFNVYQGLVTGNQVTFSRFSPSVFHCSLTATENRQKGTLLCP